MKNNVTKRKPNSHIKTSKASVQTYVNSDGTITVTTSRCGGDGKGIKGGRFKSKQTIGK